MAPVSRRLVLGGVAGAALAGPALAVAPVRALESSFGPPVNLPYMIAHPDPEEIDRITDHLQACGHGLDWVSACEVRSALVAMRQFRPRLVYMHRHFGRGEGLRLSDALHLARESLLKGHILWSEEQGADITITRSGPYAVLNVARRPGIRSEDLVRLSCRARGVGGRLEISGGPHVRLRFVPGPKAPAFAPETW